MEPPSAPSTAPASVHRAGVEGRTLAAWTYTVSVRSLCEFTAKRGDLDRRFTPSATALEGMKGQAAVVARRGGDYVSELPLEARFDILRIRGRADGYDPGRRCLEEVKTIRGDPDEIPENRRHLHWAQLETYGAMLCRERGLSELHLALVYVDAATLAETVRHRRCRATDLDAAFTGRCQRFLAWAQQEAAHRAARDAGLAELRFPPGDFRPGQRALAEAVYRAGSSGRCLLAQAPTGIGKTLGTLYPLLRAMPGQQLDKIAYLTCKSTGRLTALEALGQLRDAHPGGALRVLALVARDQACEQPGTACHGDACPLAKGFYDRLPAARAEAVEAGWLDPDSQRRIALRHQICPYHLGHELLRWTDVVVGDVHHAFDLNGQLHALAQAQDWRIGMLVDEAHNLIERARRMYSAALRLDQIRSAMTLAPAALRHPFDRLLRVARDTAAAQTAGRSALDSVPDAFVEALSALVAALGEHLQNQPMATGPLLSFHFDALRFQRLADCFAEHSVFDIERDPLGPIRGAAETPRRVEEGVDTSGIDATTFNLRNLVPAGFLRQRFKTFHSVTLFSATLGPDAYQRDLLGLPHDTAWIDVPPAFPPEHLSVHIAGRVSTRFPDRVASLDALVDVMTRQYAEQPGNYLAFFSSFDYLEQVAGRLGARQPTLPQWRQSRVMDESSRRAFLDRFVRDGRGIGFAVLGGAFAEGIDLPGTRLIGAFIATLGLPPVTPMQDHLRSRLDALFGAGHGYADLVPAMHRVVQAAGRVLRTPEDRGWVWLVDDRYQWARVRRLLPAWWRINRQPGHRAAGRR